MMVRAVTSRRLAGLRRGRGDGGVVVVAVVRAVAVGRAVPPVSSNWRDWSSESQPPTCGVPGLVGSGSSAVRSRSAARGHGRATGGLEHLDDDDRDVVPAAGGVGGVHQRLRGRLGVVGAEDEAGDLLVGHLVDQAVGAEQVAVAALGGEQPRVDGDRRFHAEHPGHDVAMRMLAGLLGGDLAGGQHLLHVAVVPGQLAQLAVGQEIGAAVADVGQHEPVAVVARRGGDEGERGAHAPRGRILERAPVHRLVGRPDDVRHRGHGGDLGIEAGLDGLERDRAGHLAGGVATHAVGHREHARRGEHPVLVGLADAARIGRGAPPELGHQPSPMGRAVMRPP